MYKNVTEVFNSVNEFYAALQKRSVNEIFKNRQISQRVGDESFFGTKDIQSADKLLLNGDLDNSEKLQAIHINKRQTQFGTRIKKQTTRNVVGFLPCIPAYLSGQPRNMFSVKNIYEKSKIVNIAISKTVPYSVKADQMILAGAKIASVVCSLEKSGMRVNLYIGATVESEGQKITCIIKIKNSGAPLNKLMIAYPIVNPSFLRRHYFRWIETCQSDLKKKFRSNYGNVTKFDTSAINDSKSIELIDVIEKNLDCDEIIKQILS